MVEITASVFILFFNRFAAALHLYSFMMACCIAFTNGNLHMTILPADHFGKWNTSIAG